MKKNEKRKWKIKRDSIRVRKSRNSGWKRSFVLGMNPTISSTLNGFGASKVDSIVIRFWRNEREIRNVIRSVNTNEKFNASKIPNSHGWIQFQSLLSEPEKEEKEELIDEFKQWAQVLTWKIVVNGEIPKEVHSFWFENEDHDQVTIHRVSEQMNIFQIWIRFVSGNSFDLKTTNKQKFNSIQFNSIQFNSINQSKTISIFYKEN
jgi:hypothetical protein